MKNISIILVISVFLFSCGNEKNKTEKMIKQKQNVVLDSAQIDSKTIPDSSQNDLNKEVQNILDKKEKEASNSVKSISELWEQYKSSKAKAISFIASDELDSIIYYLNIAANSAYDLSREDIATWQLNNIGYYSIINFKKKTDYDERIQTLAIMTNLREKGLFLKETKKVFSENFNVLENARSYLFKAQLMDSELEKSERTDAIERNLKFIEWIDNFISANRQKIKRN